MKRNCPECGGEIIYKSKRGFDDANKANTICRKCSSKNTKINHPDLGKKISNTLKKKYDNGELISNMDGAHSLESRLKMGQTKKDNKLSEKHKNSIKLALSKSDKFKSSFTKERANKISIKHKGKTFSNETKMKMSKNHADISGHKNPSKRIDVKLKIRLKAIEQLNRKVRNGFVPNYNKNACELFNKMMQTGSTFIQHAENGGEFYIKELGFWLDGYDQLNNVVYEYDENNHYKAGKLRDKDVERQKLIENHLKCKFIRIKES
jgi:hypothetical protein